jgi:hypothetical protein
MINEDIEHLLKLERHIKNVQQAGFLLGIKIMIEGEKRGNEDDKKLGVAIISLCMKHDNSKYYGNEFRYLREKYVGTEEFERALRHHQQNNQHHPEWWVLKHIDGMDNDYLAEMVCDWYARSCEQGHDFIKWIEKDCREKYDKMSDETHMRIKRFAYLLLEPNMLGGHP